MLIRTGATIVFAACLTSSASADEPDQLPATYLQSTSIKSSLGSSIAAGGPIGRKNTGGLLGIDSIPNWSGYFYDPGVDASNFPHFSWTYTMVGQSPLDQGSNAATTNIPAPIIPVTVDLRNFDGSPRFFNGHRLISSPAPYVTTVVNSPIFQNAQFDAYTQPTQFTDAVFGAEFRRNNGNDGARVILHPSVKAGRTMILKRGTYRFAVNSDGSCCAFILVEQNTFVNALFPPGPGDTTTVMGQAETAGDVKTSDISTFLFPDTYLYAGDPSNCCALGFHSYDLEPGDASNKFMERRYVMNYSSWLSPGFSDPTLLDVATLSHEMAELFHDPFVSNLTPIWVSANGNCQNDLETGDVIEGLPHANYAIPLNGYTYHVQNEALLPWFAGQTPSSARNGAYSYPDTTILTSAAKSYLNDCKTLFNATAH